MLGCFIEEISKVIFFSSGIHSLPTFCLALFARFFKVVKMDDLMKYMFRQELLLINDFDTNFGNFYFVISRFMEKAFTDDHQPFFCQAAFVHCLPSARLYLRGFSRLSQWTD